MARSSLSLIQMASRFTHPSTSETTLTTFSDGSGWVKIKPTNSPTTGLVPASYTELISRPSPDVRPVSNAASVSTTSLAGSINSSAPSIGGRKQGPAVAPRRGGAKKPTLRHVEALYTYDPAGEGETSMQEGEKMVLIAPDQGDGWCEVESKGGRGVVPAGWVKEV
jgi:hypothetical protein